MIFYIKESKNNLLIYSKLNNCYFKAYLMQKPAFAKEKKVIKYKKTNLQLLKKCFKERNM